MSKTFDIAVVGATTLVGETLVELLEQRKFPLGQLRLLDWGDAVGKRLSFKGSHIPVQDIAGFDFTTVELALFCAGEGVAAEFVPQAVAAGCVVIDHSALYRNEADIPLVIPEINPQAIAAYSQRGIIACPAAATIQMLLCAHPLHTAVGLEHISITVCAAVSELGRAAVEELAGQTVAGYTFLAIIAMSLLAFHVGRSAGRKYAAGPVKPHSLPSHHGLFVAVWVGIPAFYITCFKKG